MERVQHHCGRPTKYLHAPTKVDLVKVRLGRVRPEVRSCHQQISNITNHITVIQDIIWPQKSRRMMKSVRSSYDDSKRMEKISYHVLMNIYGKNSLYYVDKGQKQ